MRKVFIILLLISFTRPAYNQIISGTVLDKNSGKPIYAIVYFNGTFAGTYTDQSGSFWLDISHNISMPLTISALGYYSTTIDNLITDKPYVVYLAPKIFELNEVVITTKGNRKGRKTNLSIFKREFLGATMNAMKCDITNENDITLAHISAGKSFEKWTESMIVNIDTLKAFSSNPIIINNKALGYKITFYLDKFEYSPFGPYLLIQGNCIFREDSTDSDKLQNRFERRRKSAYLGSRMHFFRALWHNDLEASGFTVRDSINRKLTYDNIVNQPDSILSSDYLKYFKYRGYMSIAYYSKTPHTYFIVEKNNVYFNKDRVIVPSSVSWAGEMARQRIGDLLPLEYEVK